MEEKEKNEDSLCDEDLLDKDPDLYLEKHQDIASALKRIFQEVKLPSEQSLPFKSLGEYRLIRKIGSGGVAQVFEAEQTSIKRRVALKILPKHMRLSVKAVKRFLREAEAQSRPNHPGIVTIYDIKEHEGALYIVQELVEEGKTLAQLLDEHRQRGRLPRGYFREIAFTISKVAEALSHVHSCGVIHRDIKPSNIMLTQNKIPKIVDFGFAMIENNMKLSQEGEWSGTPFYMSPEQALGKRDEISFASDVYSLGAALYECVTLNKPFSGDSSQEIIRKILIKSPKDPVKINPRIPKDLAMICLKAMDKVPSQRYKSMDAFAEDLKRFHDGESVLAKPASPIKKSTQWVLRNKLVSLTCAIAITTCILLLILFNTLSKQKEMTKQVFENQYLILRQALELDHTVFPEGHWRWCLDYDPDQPGVSLMEALYFIENNNLEKAAPLLRNEQTNCLARGLSSLQQDVCYLLGLVKLRLAQEMDSEEERVKLEEEAAVLIEQAGDSDFKDNLVWQYPSHPFSIPKNKSWFLLPIKLNTHHFLVHMHLGLSRFTQLYQGGTQYEFDTAVDDLKKAVEKQPENIPVRTALARVLFFFARFFNTFDGLDEAKTHLDQAILHKGDKKFFMTHITYGQICLLTGEADKAEQCFLQAKEECDPTQQHRHNLYRGLGVVMMRKGEFEKATAYLDEAYDVNPGDSHVLLSLAELYFKQKNTEKALEYAKQVQEHKTRSTVTRIETSPYLMLARIQFSLGEFNEGVEALFKAYEIGDLSGAASPRDFSLACFLMFTLPKEPATKRSENLITKIAQRTKDLTSYTPSPITTSAQGVLELFNGENASAVKEFDRAEKLRKLWPKTTQSYYWPDFARDYYLQSIAHNRLLNKTMAEKYFKDAEALYCQHPPPHIEYLDILERIRDLAKQELKL